MPLEIAVADGKLAVWHRFDVQDKAVVKDRHILMSLADSEANAIELLNSCWSKLGRTGTPPNRTYFTRDDSGLNAALALPGTPALAPTLNSRTTNRITINVDLDSPSKGGSYPEYVRVRAVPSLGGSALILDSPVSYPLPNTAVTVNTLTTATSYDVSYALMNAAGAGDYSPPTAISTL